MGAADSPEAVKELRGGIEVVTDLASDSRLWDGPGSYPSCSTYARLDGLPAVVLERCVNGVAGEALFSCDSEAARLGVAAALGVVADLHERTARSSSVDDDLLGAWVDEPVATVTLLYRPASRQAEVLRLIADELRGELLGRPVELGWGHGDYTPGNIYFIAPDGREIRGVVDWGAASPSRLASFDSGLLLLATRALREHRELGWVISKLLLQGGLPAEELALLGARQDPVSDRTLLLLCWLHHVANNLGKADYYRRHLLWRAANVDAVLRAVASDPRTAQSAMPPGSHRVSA